jgi:2-dehydropantoate 2-reductase
MRIAILGIGGVGATVTGALKKHENELILIARGKTKEAIKEKGLIFNSELLGNLVIKPSLVSDNAKEIGEVDVLFLCCKAYSLSTACPEYKSIVGPHTLVIPIQNGVIAREMVSKMIDGRGTVADGYIYCFSSIVAPGEIKNVGTMLKLGFGIMDGQEDAKAKQLANMLNEGGLPTIYGQNLLKDIWEKYAMMCGNSCAFIYFNSEAGPIQKDESKMHFLTEVYEDIKRLAKAKGVAISENLPEKYTEVFKTVSPQTTSSLYRDIRDGKTNTEFDWLVGSACRMADEIGVEVPYIKKTYDKVMTGK